MGTNWTPELMSWKIKELRQQQRDMEIRAAISWAKMTQAELEYRYNHNHDSKGRFTFSSNIASVKVETDNFNADWNVINSRAYLKKFKGVTKTSFGDKAVMEAAKRCIAANDGTTVENAVILTSTYGHKKGKDIKLSEYGGHIDIPKGKPNSYIVVHNHGNNAAFSYKDFVLVNNNPEIKTLIAAAHNGTVFKLSVGSGKRLDLSDEREYNYHKLVFQRGYDSKTGDFEMIKKYCNDYGWSFEYE